MKKTFFAAMMVMLCLAGCTKGENAFRVDTVVYIPADPTVAVTESVTPEPQTEPAKETEGSSEPGPTETEPEATQPQKASATKKTSSTSKKNNTSTKKPSSGKNNTETKPTETAVTEPAATEQTSTEPPATEPVQTQPEGTEPVPSEEPVTEPEPTEPPLYDISGYSVGSLEHAIKDAVNAYRAEAELGELSMNSRLCAIASCRGYEISQVWSHTRPDGRSYKTVLSDYGFGGSAKELLVYVSGSGDGQSVVDKWMESDSHRELLLGGFSTIGVGIYRNGGYTYVACLLVN